MAKPTFYLRPDQVMRTGVVRPASMSDDLHSEIDAIAAAFTSNSAVAQAQYGPVATVPTIEASPQAQAPTVQVNIRPGIIARFFGRR